MNEQLTFEEILYSEGGSGSKRWMGLDLCFKKSDNRYFTHRFFAPESFRDRRQISDTFRNFFDTIGVNYDEVPFQHEWYSLAAVFKEMTAEKKGTKLYAKLITRKDREVLGLTLPVFSKEPNLSYSPEETMFIQELPKQRVEIEKTTNKESQRDRTAKRNRGELNY